MLGAYGILRIDAFVHVKAEPNTVAYKAIRASALISTDQIGTDSVRMAWRSHAFVDVVAVEQIVRASGSVESGLTLAHVFAKRISTCRCA